MGFRKIFSGSLRPAEGDTTLIRRNAQSAALELRGRLTMVLGDDGHRSRYRNQRCTLCSRGSRGSGELPKNIFWKLATEGGDDFEQIEASHLTLWSVGAVFQWYWGMIDTVCGIGINVMLFASRGSRGSGELPKNIFGKLTTGRG